MSSVTFCSTTRFTDYRNRSWAAFAANGSGAPCGVRQPRRRSPRSHLRSGGRGHTARCGSAAAPALRKFAPHRGAGSAATLHGAGNHGCRIPAFLHHFSLAKRFFDEIPVKIHHFYPELPKYRRWRAKKLYNRRNFSASARFARKFLHFCTFQKLHDRKQSLRKLMTASNHSIKPQQPQAITTQYGRGLPHRAVWPRTSAPRKPRLKRERVPQLPAGRVPLRAFHS